MSEQRRSQSTAPRPAPARRAATAGWSARTGPRVRRSDPGLPAHRRPARRHRLDADPRRDQRRLGHRGQHRPAGHQHPVHADPLARAGGDPGAASGHRRPAARLTRVGPHRRLAAGRPRRSRDAGSPADDRARAAVPPPPSRRSPPHLAAVPRPSHRGRSGPTRPTRARPPPDPTDRRSPDPADPTRPTQTPTPAPTPSPTRALTRRRAGPEPVPDPSPSRPHPDRRLLRDRGPTCSRAGPATGPPPDSTAGDPRCRSR